MELCSVSRLLAHCHYHGTVSGRKTKRRRKLVGSEPKEEKVRKWQTNHILPLPPPPPNHHQCNSALLLLLLLHLFPGHTRSTPHRPGPSRASARKHSCRALPLPPEPNSTPRCRIGNFSCLRLTFLLCLHPHRRLRLHYLITTPILPRLPAPPPPPTPTPTPTPTPIPASHTDFLQSKTKPNQKQQ